MNTKIKPIVSWGIWAGGLSLIMGIVTRNQLLAGFKSDETGMSYVIAGLFLAGLFISFRAAKDLHNEWDVLNRITNSDEIPESANQTDLAAVFTKLANYKRNGETVDIHTAIDTYHTGHNSRVRSVSIMAALVISMGLLGTIVGLIMSISGLGGMVENIGLSRITMMAALKTTIAGMGTAFYTTFFGALGGLVLRAVAVSQLNSLSELCAAATEYADAKLTTRMENQESEMNQQVYKVIHSLENMQHEFEALTGRISTSVENTMAQYSAALATAGSKAMSTTDECLSGVKEKMGTFSTQMGDALGEVCESVHKADANLNSSFSGLNDSIKGYGKGLGESFAGLNSSINQAGESVAGSLADLKISLDENGSDVGVSVHGLADAVNKATGQMHTMAEARLETEAADIAGQLTLAAGSIQTYLQLKNGGKSNEQQKVA